MKRILILLLIGLPFFSFSQSDTLNRTDKFGKKYGYWKKYDDKHKLDYEGMFYNGEPVGKFIYYHPNGKTKNISYFTPNSPIVNTTMYYENGSILAEGNYYNKEKDGKWLFYNIAGKVILEENFVKGKKQGISKVFDKEGTVLLEETNWANDKKHGQYTSYYSSGKLRIKMFYNQDKMHGSFENYYENGKLKTKGQYAKDFRKGEWITYNEKGFQEKIEFFEQGVCTNMLLGFKTDNEWKLLNVTNIAYFYQNSSKTVVIQLRDSSKITVYDNVMRIFKSASQNYFIFINENVLVAYDVIKYVIPNKDNPDEAKVILLYPPAFDVTTHDDYYKMLKTVINPQKPKLE